jgi:hypothetical protein
MIIKKNPFRIIPLFGCFQCLDSTVLQVLNVWHEASVR